MSSLAKRMRKLRKTLRKNEELSDKTKDRDRKKNRVICNQRKLQRQDNEDRTAKYRENEHKRIVKQQVKKKTNVVGGRKLRELKRRRSNEKKAEEINNLHIKLEELTKQNQQLKRKLGQSSNIPASKL